MHTTIRAAVAVLVLVLAAVPGTWPYPASLNYVPTAETVGAGNMLLEFTNYGYSAMFSTESTAGILSQFGLGDCLEFGADKYETEQASETYFNAKLRIIEQNSRRPSLAFGLMDVSKSGPPTSYLVASKSIGSVRTHLGLIRGSYSHGTMAGIDLDLSDTLWFSADYLPGESNHLRLGVSRSIGSDTWVQLSFGIPNDKQTSASELALTF
ncbi:MAG: hypothetical protein ACPL7K_06820, partial [Armatimonadota bacterium]